jgi:hypothetical protein
MQVCALQERCVDDDCAGVWFVGALMMMTVMHVRASTLFMMTGLRRCVLHRSVVCANNYALVYSIGVLSTVMMMQACVFHRSDVYHDAAGMCFVERCL